jgi:hypothetical protein
MLSVVKRVRRPILTESNFPSLRSLYADVLPIPEYRQNAVTDINADFMFFTPFVAVPECLRTEVHMYGQISFCRLAYILHLCCIWRSRLRTY